MGDPSTSSNETVEGGSDCDTERKIGQKTSFKTPTACSAKHQGDPADPAEFLLSNSKFHDCHPTVGHPETDDIEKIGVSSVHLMAHSSVFRDMLADSKLADPSGANTHITDVSPATFKLMLRHVYGGELPMMTQEVAAKLALTADKYNIQQLVKKAAKSLIPTGAEDFFTPFMVVNYIKCPDLESQVITILQQETDIIIKNEQFLELDENCIICIAKQDTLSIPELELWNNLICWAENQIKKYPEKTLRDCLSKVLSYVRLHVLTYEEIANYVLPAKILTPEEFVDLTLAISKKQIPQIPGLCNLQENRVFLRHKIIWELDWYSSKCVNLNGSAAYPNLTIEAWRNTIVIENFVCRTVTPQDNSIIQAPLDISCTIVKSDNQVFIVINSVKSKSKYGNSIKYLPIIDNRNKPVTTPFILDADTNYVFLARIKPSEKGNDEYCFFPNKNRRSFSLSVTYELRKQKLEIAYKDV